jgi:hypothetical protein
VSFAIVFCFFFSISPGFADDGDPIQLKEHSGLEGPETKCKKFSYQYYPKCVVYYNIQRGLYFYRDDGTWKIFSSLPRNLGQQLGDFITIETDSDKPYLDNDKHVKKFPPDDSSEPKKKMWSKLIFILLYERAPQ